MGFTFNRSGQRVPAIAISAWIPQRSVVNQEYRHTSLIRTMRERWSLGPPLTARDAIAPDIGPVLSLRRPRPPEDWPEVMPRPVPAFNTALLPPNQPLSVLGKALLGAVLEFEKMLGVKVPAMPKEANLTGAQAIALMRDAGFKLFPGLRGET
jgi:phospholipase C